MRVQSFKEAGLSLPKNSRRSGSIKVLCPKCSHKRTKSDDPCLSITFDKTDTFSGQPCHVFKCHHCPYNGAVFEDGLPGKENLLQFTTDIQIEYRKPQINLDNFELTEDVVEWFAGRGITEETLNKFQIKGCDYNFDPSNKKSRPAPSIIFPFFKDGKLINIQYRNIADSENKRYKSVGGCQLIYFNYDSIVFSGLVISSALYIVEGPIDAMTLHQCGYPFVWSVPNGSPFKKDGENETNAKLPFHDDPDAQEVFKRIEKVVYVGDDDHQGRRLVRELATRVGIEKCYRVSYPAGCKDINEVLVMYGESKVIEVVERAERFPVEGVIRVRQLRDEVKTLYNTGFDTGLTTGFPNLDPIFRVGLGKVVLLTGVPESGKSRLMANLCNNLSQIHGIKWSAFTPENRPFGTYAAKMAQIRTGKPFGKPGDKLRMTEEELDEAIDWMDQYFSFNSPPDRSLAKILEIWKYQLATEGARYGIIDPFNYVARPDGKVDEHQFILKFMVEIADWCSRNSCTAFVVAHPTKVEPIKSANPDKNGEYPVITPYKISGSSHWNNCADFILSMWRSIKHRNAPVKLHVLKAKFEELGTSNEYAEFTYDEKTGIYTPYGSSVPYEETQEEPIPFNQDEDDDRWLDMPRRASA